LPRRSRMAPACRSASVRWPNAVLPSVGWRGGVRGLGVHTEMAGGRHCRPLPGGTHHRREESSGPGQDRLHVRRSGSSAPLCNCSNATRTSSVHPVDYTNQPHIIMRNDPHDLDQQYDADRPAKDRAASESDGHRHLSGTGGPVAVRCAAPTPSKRRQVLHVPVIHVRQARRASQAASLLRN